VSTLFSVPKLFRCLAPAIAAVAIVSLHTPPATQAQTSTQVPPKFTALDLNKDGFVTSDELDRPKVFSRVDTNGDGKISPAEAATFAAQRPSRKAEGQASTAPSAPAQSSSDVVPIQQAGNSSGPRAITVAYDSAWGTNANLLSLDIYGASQGAAPRPVLVMVHGGGWQTGDKANTAVGPQKAAFFVPRGFVYVSINYRLSPGVRHPVHAQDVARAVAWVMKNIGKYGGNPDQITLMGHSAGAQLAALVATDPTYLAKFRQSPGRLRGVIALDTAGYNIPKNISMSAEGATSRSIYEAAFGTNAGTWKSASPITHVKRGAAIPPFLVVYTQRDSSSAISREFVAALRAAGVPAAAVLANGRTHKTLQQDIGKPSDGTTDLILRFLKGANPNSFPSAV